MIRIFNCNGSLIKELNLEQGSTSAAWNTKEVNPGLYFYSIIIDNEFIESRKILIHH